MKGGRTCKWKERGGATKSFYRARGGGGGGIGVHGIGGGERRTLKNLRT